MFSSTQTIAKIDAELHAAIEKERERQESHIELIASENFTTPAVMEAQGSILTNKYAEGYPGRRYYGGCQHVDIAEQLAIDRAKLVFGVDFVNVQPHSGSQANQAVFNALLAPGDTILGMDISHGGHLTHGAAVNNSGKTYKAFGYGLNPDDETIDYAQVEALAKEHKPKLIICGASAYSLHIDFDRFRAIADSVGAYLLADIAHYAGLVAAGLYPSPAGKAHLITTTTHKTLRGPRGGMVMGDAEFEKKINSTVFPGIQGGPLLPAIAGKALALKQAMEPEFRQYQQAVLDNALAMAKALTDGGLRLVSGTTQSHMMLVDLRGKNITGKDAQAALDTAHITTNKNGLPNDPQPPAITSGIRLGTPSITSRGFTVEDSQKTASFILRVLDEHGSPEALADIAAEVRALCASRPIYS